MTDLTQRDVDCAFQGKNAPGVTIAYMDMFAQRGPNVVTRRRIGASLVGVSSPVHFCKLCSFLMIVAQLRCTSASDSVPVVIPMYECFNEFEVREPW
jgi:hypothetical protein